MELIQKAMINNFDIISMIPEKELNLLKYSLGQIEHIGIKDFGYRVIDRRGKSAVLSTSEKWLNIDKDRKFLKHMSEHMNFEIKFVRQNKLSFITRSQDKINTPFLQSLVDHHVNNSVITFNFLRDKIEIFYFFPEVGKIGGQDLILNNLPYLSSVTNRMTAVLKLVDESPKFIFQKEQVLNDGVLQFLWKSNLNASSGREDSIKIIYKQKILFVRPRELECLVALGQGLGNKSIASKLGIAESTVKEYVSNLKHKFSISCREDLIKMMHEPEMQYLNQLMSS